MIVVKLEMWPRGDASKARSIGEATIVNVGGDAERGSYEVTLLKSMEYAKRPGVWRKGRVANFPRRRLGPWDLLLRGLIAACGVRSAAEVRELGEGVLHSDCSPDAAMAAVAAAAVDGGAA